MISKICTIDIKAAKKKIKIKICSELVTTDCVKGDGSCFGWELIKN